MKWNKPLCICRTNTLNLTTYGAPNYSQFVGFSGSEFSSHRTARYRPSFLLSFHFLSLLVYSLIEKLVKHKPNIKEANAKLVSVEANSFPPLLYQGSLRVEAMFSYYSSTCETLIRWIYHAISR